MLWFDLHCGISGDMLLGALLGLGAPVEELNGLLRSLPDDLEVRVSQGSSEGFGGVKARVTGSRKFLPYWPQRHGVEEHRHAPDHPSVRHHHYDHPHDHHHGTEEAGRHDGGQGHEHRTLADIRSLLGDSTFPHEVIATSLRAFEFLAKAEAEAHGVQSEAVHFHEVGAIDSIADLVGCCWAWHRLGCPELRGSALNLGGGTVRCAHGTLAVPAPAVALLVQGFTVESTGAMEKTTPTGAALLRALGFQQGPMPSGKMLARVCSLGDRQTGEFNGLTVYRIDVSEREAEGQVIQLDCWVDDMNPQDWPPLFDAVRDAGALEWFFTQGLGKKGRPACALTVLCNPADQEAVTAALFNHSTTLGLRVSCQRRSVCSRSEHRIDLRGHPVRVKVACWQGKEVNRSYEYEDLRCAADALGLSLAQVRGLAERADHLS